MNADVFRRCRCRPAAGRPWVVRLSDGTVYNLNLHRAHRAPLTTNEVRTSCNTPRT